MVWRDDGHPMPALRVLGSSTVDYSGYHFARRGEDERDQSVLGLEVVSYVPSNPAYLL
jgi:hypothetical protein